MGLLLICLYVACGFCLLQGLLEWQEMQGRDKGSLPARILRILAAWPWYVFLWLKDWIEENR